MPHSQRVIRTAIVGDLERIHEIAVEAWTPIFSRYKMIVGERMWHDVWGGWEANWVRFSPEKWHGRGIVTEVDGEIAGFAMWLAPGETLAEVGGNAVDARYQGRGIGSAQIRWVVDKFRADGLPAAKVHTGMDPAHGPARAEYRKAGLRKGILNSQYHNYLDEVARLPVRRELEFRWAMPDDAGFVRDAVMRAWQPIYDRVRERLGDELFGFAFNDVLRRRADELAGVAQETPARVRIVHEAGEPVGFAILEETPDKKLGAIRAIGVVPSAQGRGVGAGLCMDAFDVFRSHDLAYARFAARLGEVTWATRQLCWNTGLYRELPSIDYYTLL